MNRSWRGSRRQSRRGAALAMALCGLLVVMLLAAAAVRGMLLARESHRQAHRRLQSQLLLESAVIRAAARWRREPDYTGETWQLVSDDQGVRRPGKAVIQIESLGPEPTAPATRRCRVSVVADWPEDSQLRARTSYSGELVLPSSEARPSEATPSGATPSGATP